MACGGVKVMHIGQGNDGDSIGDWHWDNGLLFYFILKVIWWFISCFFSSLVLY